VRLPRFGRRHNRDLEPKRTKLRRQQIVDLTFVPWGVARIESNQFLKEGRRRVECVERRLCARHGDERGEQGNSDQDGSSHHRLSCHENSCE